jgi:pyruvate dehydrogenase E2 component (dihydrolipoamide acetyltransferase)
LQLSVGKPQFLQILMPALSSTMKEGKIVSWSKKVGDKIAAGDMVLVVESDKADMDVESYEDGYLAVIAVGDGQSAPVGAPVAYLAKTKDDISAVQTYVAGGGGSASAAPSSTAAAPSSPGASATSTSTNTVAAAPAPAIVNDGRIAASGYAKQIAQQQGIDLRTVTPSRSDQYITSKDVLATASSSTSTGSTDHVPAAGVINATPMARKLAAENNLDISQIKGTGNFQRVTSDDVLRAAGKLPATPVVSAPAAATPAAAPAADKKAAAAPTTEKVLDGIVAMTGIQTAVAKNMEKTLSVPVFRVSR